VPDSESSVTNIVHTVNSSGFISDGKALKISDVLSWSDEVRYELGDAYGVVNILDVVKRMIASDEKIQGVHEFVAAVEDFLNAELF